MAPRSQRVRSYIVLLSLAVVVVVLDQWTKHLVRTTLPLNEPYQPIAWLAPLFVFRHTQNTGAAFGLFPGLNVLFAVVAVLVILGVLIYYRRLEANSVLLRIALGLQLGGAFGNLIDRLTYGYVTDFVDPGWWPIFNVADSGLVVGTILLAYYVLFLDRPAREGQPEVPVR